jgi:hypothetical protein
MTWRQVSVPLHHRQGLPAPQLLHGAKVNASHYEPASERVVIAVPRMPLPDYAEVGQS